MYFFFCLSLLLLLLLLQTSNDSCPSTIAGLGTLLMGLEKTRKKREKQKKPIKIWLSSVILKSYGLLCAHWIDWANQCIDYREISGSEGG